MQQSPGKRLFLCLISGWGVRFSKLLSSWFFRGNGIVSLSLLSRFRISRISLSIFSISFPTSHCSWGKSMGEEDRSSRMGTSELSSSLKSTLGSESVLFLCSCSTPSRHMDLSISVMNISRQHCSWMKSRQISGWISPSSRPETEMTARSWCAARAMEHPLDRVWCIWARRDGQSAEISPTDMTCSRYSATRVLNSCTVILLSSTAPSVLSRRSASVCAPLPRGKMLPVDLGRFFRPYGAEHMHAHPRPEPSQTQRGIPSLLAAVSSVEKKTMRADAAGWGLLLLLFTLNA